MRVLAVVAPLEGAAQGRSAAGFDGLHQAVLVQRQTVCLPVSRAVLSKDGGQLQGWPWHQALRGRPAFLAGRIRMESSGLAVAAILAGDTAV